MLVRCRFCHRQQGDQGRGQTCDFCGSSPLPSYQYDEGSAFYPPPNEKPTQKQRIMAEIDRRRKEVGASAAVSHPKRKPRPKGG